MNLVLGLGNPGTRYISTRHNMGFLVLDILREKLELPEFSFKKKLHSNITEGKGVVLAKPETFMNASGTALDLLIQKYTLEISDIVVIHDDLDIPFGNLKLHKNGNPAGHNGLLSFSSSIDLGNLYRLRCGIAGTERGMRSGEKYVLSRFTKSEREILPDILDRAASALILLIEEGAEKAAQQYNQKPKSES